MNIWLILALAFCFMVIGMMIWSAHWKEVKRKEAEMVRRTCRHRTLSSQKWLDEYRDGL